MQPWSGLPPLAVHFDRALLKSVLDLEPISQFFKRKPRIYIFIQSSTGRSEASFAHKIKFLRRTHLPFITLDGRPLWLGPATEPAPFANLICQNTPSWKCRIPATGTVHGQRAEGELGSERNWRIYNGRIIWVVSQTVGLLLIRYIDLLVSKGILD